MHIYKTTRCQLKYGVNKEVAITELDVTQYIHGLGTFQYRDYDGKTQIKVCRKWWDVYSGDIVKLDNKVRPLETKIQRQSNKGKFNDKE
jgi:hypothetical protein